MRYKEEMKTQTNYDDFYNNLFSSISFFTLLIFYNTLSSMYIMLPPLFGILFLYFIKLINARRNYSLFVFCILLGSFEIDKGSLPGILFIIYSLMYIFVIHKFIKTFENLNLFEFVYIFIIYVAYATLNTTLILMNDGNTNTAYPMLLFYVLVECVLLMVIRWISDIK